MKPQTGPIAWFANNSVAANLMMWLFIIGGLFSVYTINKEVFPPFELNYVQVTVAYPGAAPQEIEEGITIKVEEAIKDITGIKQVSSVARDGLATVTIEVDSRYKAKDILDEVKMSVDAISTFPESIESPNIFQIKPKNLVMFVSIYGDLSEVEMKELAKATRDNITSLPNVSSADLMGVVDYEISIEVSEDKLREYGLSFAQVAQAVQRSSLDLPGGSIRAAEGDILLRTKAQAYNQQDFEKIVVSARNDGSRILLSDVARVVDGFADWEAYVRFNGKPAAIIQINSVDDQDALLISKQVNQWVADQQALLPSGAYVDTWMDLSYYLDGRLDMMTSNVLYGSILVFLILALFLNIKLAFWVMMGLPICFLGAFMLMPYQPFSISINLLSLFAFILVLGIVVDDAIVTGESVAQEIEANGHSVESVVTGVRKVATPATFGVLTSVVAFIPMLLVTGALGSISANIGWVVILCLLFSLLESKFILPAHLAHMHLAKPSANPNIFIRFKTRFNQGVQNFIYNRYKPFLARCLAQRYNVMAVFIGIMILAISLVASGKVRWVFFPEMPSDFIQVNIEMDPASSDQQTIAAAQTVEQALFSINDEAKVNYGFPLVEHYFAAKPSSDTVMILAELSKTESRNIDAFSITELWRAQVPLIAGLKKITFEAGQHSQGGAIGFQLSSNDYSKLTEVSAEIQKQLASYAGVYDISDNYSSGSHEILLNIKPEAESLGLSLSDLASQVRYAFYGYEVQRILRDKEEVRVMVRFPAELRRSIGDLETMLIRSPDGTAVPFSSVAEVEFSESYSAINRIDGKRALQITANANTEIVEPAKVIQELQKEFLPLLKQRFPTVDIELAGSSLEEQESLVTIAQGFVMVLLAIFALIAIPLKSYSQPLIIMSVIPFGIIGALFGHYSLGLPLSMLSLFGIIALSGVVVNDSLVLVDYVNQCRNRGVAMRDAVAESGCVRFRAILLTSLTTFFGLVPMMLETSLQAQVMIPMAVSLGFGILFSTFVTLILVPVLYLILDDIKLATHKLYKWWWQPKLEG